MLHKRLADIDAKIVQYYEKNGHVTGDVIRAFLEDNYELLRPDSGKDFVEFAKGLVTHAQQIPADGVAREMDTKPERTCRNAF